MEAGDDAFLVEGVVIPFQQFLRDTAMTRFLSATRTFTCLCAWTSRGQRSVQKPEVSFDATGRHFPGRDDHRLRPLFGEPQDTGPPLSLLEELS